MKNTRRFARVCAVLVTLAASGTAMPESPVTFESSRAFETEWSRGITGKGAAHWEVVADDTAPSKHLVLRQSGEATFCWAVQKGVSLVDGFVEVKIKPVSGKEDQAGGLVF